MKEPLRDDSISLPPSVHILMVLPSSFFLSVFYTQNTPEITMGGHQAEIVCWKKSANNTDECLIILGNSEAITDICCFKFLKYAYFSVYKDYMSNSMRTPKTKTVAIHVKEELV